MPEDWNRKNNEQFDGEMKGEVARIKFWDVSSGLTVCLNRFQQTSYNRINK